MHTIYTDLLYEMNEFFQVGIHKAFAVRGLCRGEVPRHLPALRQDRCQWGERGRSRFQIDLHNSISHHKVIKLYKDIS